jgi:hypothetical protein
LSSVRACGIDAPGFMRVRKPWARLLAQQPKFVGPRVANKHIVCPA